MVGRWGMSERIGPIAVLPSDGDGLWLPGASETSADMQRLVDEEVHNLVEDAHKDATELLRAHRDQLESLAQALLKAETLDMIDAYTAAGLTTQMPEPEPNAVA
jgi:cell division protease FtsH